MMKSAFSFVIFFTLLALTASQGNETASNTTESVNTQPPTAQETENLNNETTTESPPGNSTETEDDDVEPETPVGCSLHSELDGDWWSTMWGNVSVVNGRLLGVEIADTQTVLGCHSSAPDGFLIVREELDENSDDESIFYTCIKFVKRNSNNFHVEIKTARNDMFNKEPVVALSSNETWNDPKLICNGITVLNGELLRQDKEEDGALGCPQPLNGRFNLTYTGVSSVECPDGATMSSCEQPKTLSIDCSACNGSGEYIGDKEYKCVAGGNDFVTTFQLVKDSPVFECLKLSVDKSNADQVDVSSKSRGCGDDWDGELPEKEVTTYTLTKSDDCEQKTNPTKKPERKEGPKDAASSLGPCTLLMTSLVSLIFLVISRH